VPKYQKGQLLKRHGSWHVRYYSQGKQQSSVIARVSDYPLKKDIQPHFEMFMAKVNDAELGTHDPFFSQLVEDTYFPSLDNESENGYKKLASSTIDGYKDIWNKHVKDRVNHLRLSQLRPVDAFKILEDIAKQGFSVYTVQHVKHFISGIYSWARQNGHFDDANPIQGVKLPKAKPPEETHAYSLDEVNKILSCLGGRAQLACYIAAYTGLDKGEIEGLRWEDFKNGDLHVTRKVWCGEVKDPKTEIRKSPVPILKILAEKLNAYHKQIGKPESGWVFTASRGSLPVRMDNILRREILPNLTGVKWHGWHAFRRGLATNLRAIGIADDLIQRMLRHSDVQTTQRFYAKTLDVSLRDAMRTFDKTAIKAAKESRDNQGTAKSRSTTPPKKPAVSVA